MYDTIIIGTGIAGLTASIYASRKRMNFLLIGKEFGGQFNASNKILNYPGFSDISGYDFNKRMQEQIKFNSIIVKEDEVKEVKKIKNGSFIVKTKNSEFETQSVIIATGSNPKKLSVKGEEEFLHKGVTYCSICDGPLFKGKDVAVIGGGNSALEAVDFLVNIAQKIYVINLTNELTAHEYLIENTKKHKNVFIINNAETTEIFGDKIVKGVKYKTNGEEKEVRVSGVFIEVGRVPVTEFVKDLVKTNETKHIIIDCFTRTSVEGIFAAGDCAGGQEYQYVIAAGQGAMSLIKAARYLANKKK